MNMRHIITLCESAPPVTSSIQLPEYYFRGSSEGMRSVYLTKVWSKPSDDLPEFCSDLLSSERVSRVYGLSYNLPFRVSRTYQGMSNWGFGVYFAASIDWASRYGNCISVVQIDPASVLAISADDFAHRVEGTAGADLRTRLDKATGNSMSMRDEAEVMSKVVRSMQRGAKALYVETSPGEGQICVFGKSTITPRFYFELRSK